MKKKRPKAIDRTTPPSVKDMRVTLFEVCAIASTVYTVVSLAIGIFPKDPLKIAGATLLLLSLIGASALIVYSKTQWFSMARRHSTLVMSGFAVLFMGTLIGTQYHRVGRRDNAAIKILLADFKGPFPEQYVITERIYDALSNVQT
jgi:hypothetical protein